MPKNIESKCMSFTPSTRRDLFDRLIWDKKALSAQ